MLYITGISIAFFLSFLLLTKREKSFADRVLIVWLFFIGIHLFLYYLFITDEWVQYPFMIGVGLPFPLLHGPFLFLYVSSVTNRLKNLSPKVLLHFAPPLVSYLFLIPFFLLPIERKIFVFQNNGIGYENYNIVNITAIIISGIIYVGWSFILLIWHKRSIMNQFSDIDKINFDWLRYLISGIALIWIFVIFGNDTLVFCTSVLLVMFIGYFGIRQVGIFNPESGSAAKFSETTELLEFLPEKMDNQKKKYVKSGLTAETAEELHRKLLLLMETEKPYKESELFLTDLANRLNAVPNYLSQIINEKEGKSFYDYINTLRVEEFIRTVKNPDSQKFTLLSLAHDCGFNSKSSFNRYFKKVTGQSPSEYLKQPD